VKEQLVYEDFYCLKWLEHDLAGHNQKINIIRRRPEKCEEATLVILRHLMANWTELKLVLFPFLCGQVEAYSACGSIKTKERLKPFLDIRKV
jgi:hypothetical protein